jgi:CarD family transcriptional regulator
MQFSVGDKVVHPHYGPGRIARVERKELLDGPKRYYVIDIPVQGLTVRVPVRKASEAGVRPAMGRSRLPQVFRTLRSTPRRLPQDFRVRQEEIGAELKSGRVLQLARVVRDLTWHRERDHLTRKDTEHLKQGQKQLAAEMALVSDDDLSETSERIESAVMTAVTNGLLARDVAVSH